MSLSRIALFALLATASHGESDWAVHEQLACVAIDAVSVPAGMHGWNVTGDTV